MSGPSTITITNNGATFEFWPIIAGYICLDATQAWNTILANTGYLPAPVNNGAGTYNDYSYNDGFTNTIGKSTLGNIGIFASNGNVITPNGGNSPTLSFSTTASEATNRGNINNADTWTLTNNALYTYNEANNSWAISTNNTFQWSETVNYETSGQSLYYSIQSGDTINYFTFPSNSGIQWFNNNYNTNQSYLILTGQGSVPLNYLSIFNEFSAGANNPFSDSASSSGWNETFIQNGGNSSACGWIIIGYLPNLSNYPTTPANVGYVEA